MAAVSTETPIDQWLNILPPHLRGAAPVLVALLEENGQVTYTSMSSVLTPESWGAVLEAARLSVIAAYAQRGADAQEIERRIEEGKVAAQEAGHSIMPIAQGPEN